MCLILCFEYKNHYLIIAGEFLDQSNVLHELPCKINTYIYIDSSNCYTKIFQVTGST